MTKPYERLLIVPPSTNGEDATAAAWSFYCPAALRLARVLVGRTDSHDVMVNAFLRVDRRRRWSELTNPQSYLLSAVHSEASNFHRRRRRRLAREVRAFDPSTATGGTDSLDKRVDVRQAVLDLSFAQRAAVYLVYWEDLTEAAAAEVLDVSPGTVHRNLVRARRHLERTL